MNKDTAMTQQESEVMIKELSKVFDVVRLLDEETLETGNIKDITDAEGFYVLPLYITEKKVDLIIKM